MTFGVALPSATRLPSLSFLPTTTVYSACCRTGLLHPATGRGVRAVSSAVSCSPCFHDVQSSAPFPGSHLIPSEVFPSEPAELCHHSRFLLAVVPSCCFQRSGPRPQGFALLRSPLPLTDVAIRSQPDTPLGFVPLQGSPLILRCSSEKLRSFTAEAALLWTTPAEAAAPWMCLHRSASLTSRSLSIPTVVQPKLPPATNLTPMCPVRRPADRSQPALELFERPLIRFSLLPCRLRWSPAWLPPALQRSFRDEVALISRVFSFLNRSS